MKLRFSVLALFLVVVCTPLPLFADSPNISPSDARKLLQENGDVFILDVRTPREYFDARIEGARLIPDQVLASRLKEVPRDRPLLVYCAVGYRSSKAVQLLLSRGYTNLYNLYGGIWAWRLKGYPVLQGPP